MKKSIYLDHAATTPIDPKVLKAMLPYLKDNFGNVSSLHTFGQKAAKGVEDAREIIAKFLNCESGEIVFTSGATESNNLAIFGVNLALKKRYPQTKLHIITSQIEHPAILEPYQRLEHEGFEVTYLPVNKQGLVEISSLQKAIKNNTVFISIMYANNEIGTIQPIKEIGELIETINQKRGYKTSSEKNYIPKTPPSQGGAGGVIPLPIFFHTDAVQALYYSDCDTQKLKVDLLSLSGHKIYGPKGVGALFIKNHTPLLPITIGGHQEKNRRSGTYNSPGIVGLGKAIELLTTSEHQKNIKTIKKLRDYLISQIQKKITELQVNGEIEHRLAGNANISFYGAEGESILILLDMAGIAISTGSACSSGSLNPSHVLMAMKIPPEICHGSVRMTLGKNTTKEEIDYAVKELVKTIKKLRAMAPK